MTRWDFRNTNTVVKDGLIYTLDKKYVSRRLILRYVIFIGFTVGIFLLLPHSLRYGYKKYISIFLIIVVITVVSDYTSVLILPKDIENYVTVNKQ